MPTTATRTDARRTRPTPVAAPLLRYTIFLIAACALSACATGPIDSKTAPQAQTVASPVNPACPDLAGWGARQLYGAWELDLPALGQHGTLLLRQHPEFSESLRGEFSYGGHTSIASGDLDEGELNLDESRDGKSLYAFWTGHLVVARCGREIRGTWQQLPQPGQPALDSPFVLRRAGSGSAW